MPPRRTDLACLAITRPGLEEVCAAELRELGLRVDGAEPGAVAFHAPTRGLYLAVQWLRTAVRVLQVVGTVRARTFGTLERGLPTIPWTDWVRPGQPVRVRVRTEQARLYHSGAVEQRVTDAIRAAVPGLREDAASVDPAIVDVRVEDDVATVRIDATGDSADRRGWRLATAKAPLPPTVAAAVLQTIEWDGRAPLLDPLCGSGTIPVEAALRATRRPSAVGRDFAVRSWPTFAPGTWSSAAAGTGPHDHLVPATIVGTDRDPGAVGAAQANATRAGVADRVRLSAAPLSAALDHLPDTAPFGWVVTNPPWGRRIDGTGDLRDLHATLGAVMGRLPGWRLALVTGDPRMAAATGLSMTRRWHTSVGGQAISLFTSG